MGCPRFRYTEDGTHIAQRSRHATVRASHPLAARNYTHEARGEDAGRADRRTPRVPVVRASRSRSGPVRAPARPAIAARRRPGQPAARVEARACATTNLWVLASGADILTDHGTLNIHTTHTFNHIHSHTYLIELPNTRTPLRAQARIRTHTSTHTNTIFLFGLHCVKGLVYWCVGACENEWESKRSGKEKERAEE